MRGAPLTAALLLALLPTLLAGCASAPPPATVLDARRFGQAAVPGATRASVLAALGPTRAVSFDSGAQVWLYVAPRGADRYAEFVILFDRAGRLVSTRIREPD